jgi:hypothetical protein
MTASVDAMPERMLAEFTTPDAMLHALEQLRAAGYRELEAYSPFPVGGVSERLGLPRSRLPWLVFGAGTLGAVLGYGIQWVTNVWLYPQNAGGRPPHAPPAFVLSTFEAAVLLAALAAFVGLLIALRLPQLSHPVFETDAFESASVDAFWIEVRNLQSLIDADHSARLLADAGAVRMIQPARSE